MATFIEIACLLYFILVVLNNSIYEADIKYKGVSCRWLCVLIADHKFEVQFFLISSRMGLGYYRNKREIRMMVISPCFLSLLSVVFFIV